MMAVVSTPYGDFELTRSDAVAITVIKVKKKVRHFRKWWDIGDISHVEHRRKPDSIEKIKTNFGWATYMATFDLNGRHILLAPHVKTFKKPKKVKKISRASSKLIGAVVYAAGQEYHASEYASCQADVDEATQDLFKARAALEKRILFLESRQMVKVYGQKARA